jgi:hypothetical protein
MPLMRADTAAVQVMAARWAASAGELSEARGPAGGGLSCQASAFAVAAAHADVAAFTAALGTRVGAHATHVGDADAAYQANDADAANAMAALTRPVIGV